MGFWRKSDTLHRMVTTMHRGLEFERLMMIHLGEKASRETAGMINSDPTFRKYLQKCLPNIRKKIRGLDTALSHKQCLMNYVEEISDLLKSREENSREIVHLLFWLVTKLLGLGRSIEGNITQYDITPQPFFHQTTSQYLLEQARTHKTDFFTEEKTHKNNVIALQREIHALLKKRGLSDQVVAGVLNTSEYQVKRMKWGI